MLTKFKQTGAEAGQTNEYQGFVQFSIWKTKKVGAAGTLYFDTVVFACPQAG
jgi:hypothetical protein